MDDGYDPFADEGDGLEYFRRLEAYLEDGTGAEDLMAAAPPPPLESLSKEELPRALTDLVWGLYDQGVLISDTDHLTDRELYAELLEFLEEPHLTFPHDPYSNLHWSPIGGCSEDDMAIHHRYYASEEDRQRWMRDFPEDEMPPSELPPYPRRWIPDAVPRTPRREAVEP